MRLQRKLTKAEWAEIGEKYRDGGVHMYRGKRTLFYNGERLWKYDWKGHVLLGEKIGHPLVYNEGERQTWEVLIVLPGVEKIPFSTFYECVNVKTVIMADSVTRIEDYAFQECYCLKIVKLSTNLEYIGHHVFAKCFSLTSIFIPPSCRKIDYQAFEHCVKLMIFTVPPNTRLGGYVIDNTALIGLYFNSIRVNKWIKNRHSDFPLHKLCCSEHPTFNQTTIIPTKHECCRQDDLGWTPLIYLIHNNTTDYGSIEQMVTIGGKESLLIEDKKGKNVLHHAFHLGDESVVRLLVKIGGRELLDLLGTIDYYRPHQAFLLLRNYSNPDWNINLDQTIDTFLDSTPKYRNVIEIMSNKDIPDKYLERLQDYNNAIIEKGVKLYTKKKATVPLMRSKLAVVGRGRDGKTSTIYSLKGSPFQSYCESTKGAETSEVDVREIGIDVTNVEVSRAAFEKAERDPYSTQRSVAMKVMNKSLPRLRQRGNHFSFSSFWKCLMPKFIKELKWNVCYKGKYQQNIVDTGTIINPHTASGEKNIATKKAFNKDMNKEENLQPIVNPNPRSEEKDIGKKKADVKFSNPDGKSIRMTIFDYGGQRVFRSIQNLFLSREGIFIVVFDMMKLLMKVYVEMLLEHLKYWISSIKMDACLETNANEPIDPSIKYPPVILVGTHYDEFLKLKGDPSQGLEVLNKTLIDNLPLSDLIPLSNH